ncbi:Dbl homology domain-containing protein [Hyaloraphidium curvatum]|nr:Dbl homology domain-containing protein [Hyaloraphidium curvatum]
MQTEVVAMAEPRHRASAKSKESVEEAGKLVQILQQELERRITRERSAASSSRDSAPELPRPERDNDSELSDLTRVDSTKSDFSESSLGDVLDATVRRGTSEPVLSPGVPSPGVPVRGTSPKLPPRRVKDEESGRLIRALKDTLDPRAHALADLFESEVNFLRALEAFLNILAPEIKAKKVLPAPTYERLVERSGIRDIHLLHRELVFSLTRTFAAAEASLENPDPSSHRSRFWGSNVGELFVDAFAGMIAAYTRFTVRYWLVRHEIAQLDSIAWKAFEVRARTDKRIGKSALEIFFLPIQRIQRYPMVLSELLRHTPEEHPDYGPLQKAYAQMTALANAADSAKAEEDARVSTIGAFRTTSGFPAGLVSAKRLLIAETDVYERSCELYLHAMLFSDCLVLSKHLPQREGDHRYSFHGSFDLRDLAIEPLRPEPGHRYPVPQDMLQILHEPTTPQSALTILPEKPDDEGKPGLDFRSLPRIGKLVVSPLRAVFSSSTSLPRKQEGAADHPSRLTFVWLRSAGDLYPEKTRAAFEHQLSLAIEGSH